MTALVNIKPVAISEVVIAGDMVDVEPWNFTDKICAFSATALTSQSDRYDPFTALLRGADVIHLAGVEGDVEVESVLACRHDKEYLLRMGLDLDLPRRASCALRGFSS